MDFSSIDNLEFENLDPTENQPQSESKEISQEEMIEASCKIVETLNAKLKIYNEEFCDNQANLKDLTEVYLRGAGDCSEAKDSDTNCNLWGIARVNMFLRMKSGQKMEVSKGRITTNDLIDISEWFVPSEEDFNKAKEDLEKYEMNFNFTNAEELYLEYQHLGLGFEL